MDKRDALIEQKNNRAEKEKNLYNTGFSRKKYNSRLGHAQAGYAETRKKNVVCSVLKEGKGKCVLELGSISWKDYIDFNEYSPSELTCINISEKELNKGIAAAKKLKTDKYCEHTFEIMDAHNLRFPDNSFDVVFGTGILHHLDFETALKEISRVLKKDGSIVFVEPLARNPIAKLVRKLTPNARTPDEKPLDKKEFEILSNYFNLESSYFQLFYVLAGVVSGKIFKSPNNPLTFVSDKLDILIEKIFKKTSICLLFRIVVISGKSIV